MGLVVITQTLPFMATYLGFRINKEPGYVTEIIGMMICFACVAYIIYSEEKMQNTLIIAPEGHADEEELEKAVKLRSRILVFGGIFLTILSTAMGASVNVLNRSLKHISFFLILFYHAFISSCITGILIIPQMILADRPVYFLGFSPVQNGLMFGAIGCGALASIFQTIAFQSGNSSFVSLFSYMNILYSIVINLLLFQEKISMM